ncbi:MAG: hypothetical protein WCT18_00305 [Patescibacteria group bacterium]
MEVIMDFQELLNEIKNDSEWARNEVAELRDKFHPGLLDKVRRFKSRTSAIDEGVSVVRHVLNELCEQDFNIKATYPGHGAGHLIRDYANALRLFPDLGITEEETFIGFVGGCLHDIGCAIIDRYADSSRVVRHAEAGGLLIRWILQKSGFVNKAELHLIVYCIFAHTHYLKRIEIKNEQGEVVNVINPYVDIYPDGKPFYPVWTTRWVDRLDTNGPAFVGRHYLTLVHPHKDFDGKNFFDVDYAKHMRPLLRNERPDGNTMAEHLRMFANSQNNESPYGEHDFGKMVELRDAYKERLLRIIEKTKKTAKFSYIDEIRILHEWNVFLVDNVEFSDLTEEIVNELGKNFAKLPVKTRRAWLHTFACCLVEYTEWAAEMDTSLGRVYGFPYDEYFCLPDPIDDIFEHIYSSGH